VFGCNFVAPLADLRVLGGLSVHPVFLDDVLFNAEMILNRGKLLGGQVGHRVIPPNSANFTPAAGWRSQPRVTTFASGAIFFTRGLKQILQCGQPFLTNPQTGVRVFYPRRPSLQPAVGGNYFAVLLLLSKKTFIFLCKLPI